MNQQDLEKNLLTVLLRELKDEEARIKRLKVLFRDPNFAQEMDEAILSLWQAGECVQEYLDSMPF